MKIAIIGAGWYGCHLALVLKEEGHDVTVFEKNSEIFRGASGYNQFRYVPCLKRFNSLKASSRFALSKIVHYQNSNIGGIYSLYGQVWFPYN